MAEVCGSQRQKVRTKKVVVQSKVVAEAREQENELKERPAFSWERGNAAVCLTCSVAHSHARLDRYIARHGRLRRPAANLHVRHSGGSYQG